jgi:hypothetical protein
MAEIRSTTIFLTRHPPNLGAEQSCMAFNIRSVAEARSEQELQRRLHLRAIEWSAWPTFVSQPVIPVLFLFFPWTVIIVSLLVIDLFWCYFGYPIVSYRLARVGCLFVVCKWPASLGSAIYLFTQHRIVLGSLLYCGPWLLRSLAHLRAYFLALWVCRATLVRLSFSWPSR